MTNSYLRKQIEEQKRKIEKGMLSGATRQQEIDQLRTLLRALETLSPAADWDPAPRTTKPEAA